MAFNKAKEEYKWRKWKEKEEKEMRSLGVSEEMIQQLHRQDWEDFKRERNYHEHQFPNSDVVEANMEVFNTIEEFPMHTVQALLQSIEDEQLFHLLLTVEKETLQILLFRMLDIPAEEIAARMGLSANAVYLRMNRLKEKIKKFYSSPKENE